jgi:DNA-binding Lrp family transcriptional regulator
MFLVRELYHFGWERVVVSPTSVARRARMLEREKYLLTRDANYSPDLRLN